jgi:hypothetical protein
VFTGRDHWLGRANSSLHHCLASRAAGTRTGPTSTCFAPGRVDRTSRGLLGELPGGSSASSQLTVEAGRCRWLRAAPRASEEMRSTERVPHAQRNLSPPQRGVGPCHRDKPIREQNESCGQHGKCKVSRAHGLEPGRLFVSPTASNEPLGDDYGARSLGGDHEVGERHRLRFLARPQRRRPVCRH